MSLQNPIPKKLPWQLMYEGPDLGHLLAFQVFIEPFLSGESLLKDVTGFQYDYYLWYSDKKEAGGIHGGYYVKSDLSRATKRGKKIYFDKSWLQRWYKMIDADCRKVEVIMKKYRMEDAIDALPRETLIKILPEMLRLEYRLVSYVRCSQPQFTDALKNALYTVLKKRIKNKNKVEEVFLGLTMPEEKSLFSEEEIAWLNLVIHTQKVITKQDATRLTEQSLQKYYPNIWKMLYKHFQNFRLIPASDRTPAWDVDHFVRLLKTNLKSGINYREKKVHMVKQYEEALALKKAIIRTYKLPKEALRIGSRISKVGYYRFKASFFWRWMGYYMVLICKKYSKNFGLTYKEISNMTSQELFLALHDTMTVEKEELARRAEAELYLHAEGKDYIWWGDEARQKRQEILGAVDFDVLTEIQGEVANTGIVRGKAFVFYWSDDVSKKVHKMPQGSILVAPQTHPTYMPAIRLAKALVCDEGGVTGHAAIVSRELKKPCVIGLHIATKAIHTGDEIEVDANKGIVRILKRKDSKRAKN